MVKKKEKKAQITISGMEKDHIMGITDKLEYKKTLYIIYVNIQFPK